MFDIKKEVELLNEELISLRRDFHMYPETGYDEYRTSGIIQEYLKNLGMEVSVVSKTGVVGLLKGACEGKTVLLRADMDALFQEEKTGLKYASKERGKMHACGHDGHMAMLLIAAKLLSQNKECIKGNVKFVFQPNEEEAGALDMINEGVLENPKVDAAFATHLWTPIESGNIGLVEGPMMGATEEFEINILGKAGHTSAPHTAVDPILCACSLVQALQSIQTREIDPLDPITIMVGKLNGGTARNIITDRVNIGGTVRFSFKDEKMEKPLLLEKIERVVKGVCFTAGTDYELKFIPSNPSVLNDREMTDLVRKSGVETLGSAEAIQAYRCMAGEDFAEFTQRVPSCFFFIGTGSEEKGTTYPHHHPNFNIDEDTLKIGVEMHIRNVLNYLGR